MRLLILLILVPLWLTPLRADEKLSDAGLARLATQAASGDKQSREKALEALGRSKHPGVGAILRARFLLEREKSLQEMVGFLLSEHFSQDYYRALKSVVDGAMVERLPFLINHAMLEDARYLRALDLWAAMRLDKQRTLKGLLANLKSKDTNVLLRAAELLGNLGHDAAGKPLVGLLTHKATYVRIEAIGALAKLTRARVDNALVSVALRDRVSHVRRHAVWALYERGGVVRLRNRFSRLKGVRAAEALDLARIRGKSEEGPGPPFRYRGDPANVLALFRRAETKRFVKLDVAPADVKAKLLLTIDLLQRRGPKYALFVRACFSRITARENRPTGTYVTSRVFNIKASTVRKWSYYYLSKTLVHDATHAYLHMMGEKSGLHRGEEEAFQEAFWVDRYLKGSTTRFYDREVDNYLRLAHWVRKRRY